MRNDKSDIFELCLLSAELIKKESKPSLFQDDLMQCIFHFIMPKDTVLNLLCICPDVIFSERLRKEFEISLNNDDRIDYRHINGVNFDFFWNDVTYRSATITSITIYEKDINRYLIRVTCYQNKG